MKPWTLVFTFEAECEFRALPADMRASGLRIARLVKKTKKTPRREIDLALRRLAEVDSNENAG